MPSVTDEFNRHNLTASSHNIPLLRSVCQQKNWELFDTPVGEGRQAYPGTCLFHKPDGGLFFSATPSNQAFFLYFQCQLRHAIYKQNAKIIWMVSGKAELRLKDGKGILETRTDRSGSGRYSLTIYPVRGPYDLSIISRELNYMQTDIPLKEGERRVLNIKLREMVSIEGTLLMLDKMTFHTDVPVQAVMVGQEGLMNHPTITIVSWHQIWTMWCV
jgi:hypothetical protein